MIDQILAIYYFLNGFGLKDDKAIAKNDPGILAIGEWVSAQYKSGRTTGISPEEMLLQAQVHFPKYFKSNFDVLKENGQKEK